MFWVTRARQVRGDRCRETSKAFVVSRRSEDERDHDGDEEDGEHHGHLGEKTSACESTLVEIAARDWCAAMVYFAKRR